MKLKLVHKGGKGSGFHGHAGRPGKVGGSTSAGGAMSDREGGARKGEGWKMEGGGRYTLESENAIATIVPTKDGKSNYLAISYASKKDDRVVWDSEEFGQFESKYSEKRKWNDSDMEMAMERAEKRLAEFNIKFSTLPPKKRAKPGSRKIELPYYD